MRGVGLGSNRLTWVVDRSPTRIRYGCGPQLVGQPSWFEPLWGHYQSVRAGLTLGVWGGYPQSGSVVPEVLQRTPL